jgi:type VI secretion system protein ImpL
LQATLNGSGSELADTVSYVDNSLLNQVSTDTAAMVRPMLVRPLSQSYTAMLGPVQQDINQAWANEVLPQWKQLAGKYPFTDSGSAASVAEINRFVKANDGVLDKFINKYLNGLVQRKGDTLVARAWGEQGIRFNPEFLSAAGNRGHWLHPVAGWRKQPLRAAAAAYTGLVGNIHCGGWPGAALPQRPANLAAV